MIRQNFDYIIIGAGLCGLTMARELSRKDKKVLLLERGNFIKNVGNVFYAGLLYDKFSLAKSRQGVLIYRSFGVGGTSIISCNNAVSPVQECLDRIGIDFRKEISEVKKECCVSDSAFPIGLASKKIMRTANELGYDMRPMPKFGALGKCVSCGNCELGCKYGAKWTALEFLKGIKQENVTIVPNFLVKKIISFGGKASGVYGRDFKFNKKTFFGAKIILAAGGIGTPIILQNSGIDAGNNLFLALFNVTYGINKRLRQSKDPCMSVICEKFRKGEGFILSPFIDNIVSFISAVAPRHTLEVLRRSKMLGIMTKIEDDSVGKVYKNGKIDKAPTQDDLRKLNKGSGIAKEILIKCGVNPKNIIVTKPRGAHPGGTAGIGRVVNKNLETKTKNLFVCDGSVLPFAPGVPPILTLISLSKWFVKNSLEG